MHTWSFSPTDEREGGYADDATSWRRQAAEIAKTARRARLLRGLTRRPISRGHSYFKKFRLPRYSSSKPSRREKHPAPKEVTRREGIFHPVEAGEGRKDGSTTGEGKGLPRY